MHENLDSDRQLCGIALSVLAFAFLSVCDRAVAEQPKGKPATSAASAAARTFRSAARPKSCPHCAQDELAERARQLGIPLFTEWVSPSKRRRLENIDTTFTDQEGREGRLDELNSRPLLLTYFYTRCTNDRKCAASVAQLADLQKELAEAGLTDRVRLAAATFEPQHDHSVLLKQFGKLHGYEFSEDSRMLQMETEGHRKLLQELTVPVSLNAGWVNTHGVQLHLIDSHGRLARKYHTVLWDNKQVVDDVQRLLKESPQQPG